MSTNKNAMIRYQALDKCFSNLYKHFDINALVEACNEALYQYSGIKDGVKKRQVYDDISYMKSDQGWSIPLETIKDGRRVYYRYSEKGYTINSQPLTDNEIQELRETILTLHRFKGMPSFEWIDELISRLEDKFHLSGTSKSVIGFEQNQYLKGLDYLSEIFSNIINYQCIKVIYRDFRNTMHCWDIHPYYLKQYNTRWYLHGLNEKYKEISTVPLDRIDSIQASQIEYLQTDIDFEEYFDDIVGVTLKKDCSPEKVLLRFSENRYPYIISKPIHGSQRIVDNCNRLIEIEVIPNDELNALLLSFGSDVEIIEPKKLRDNIVKTVTETLNNYCICADKVH